MDIQEKNMRMIKRGLVNQIEFKYNEDEWAIRTQRLLSTGYGHYFTINQIKFVIYAIRYEKDNKGS